MPFLREVCFKEGRKGFVLDGSLTVSISGDISLANREGIWRFVALGEWGGWMDGWMDE